MKISISCRLIYNTLVMGRKRIIAYAAIALGILTASNLQANDDIDPATYAQNHAKLLHELQTIVIDELDLKGATSKEALRILAEKTIEADPQHRGISFVGQISPEDNRYRYTLTLKNVSVKEALHQMFSYLVEDTTVLVDVNPHCEGAISHTFYLPNGLFLVGPNGPSQSHMREFDVTKQLEARGVSFPPGSSAIYLSDKQELVMVAPNSDPINQVDEILYP